MSTLASASNPTPRVRALYRAFLRELAPPHMVRTPTMSRSHPPLSAALYRRLRQTFILGLQKEHVPPSAQPPARKVWKASVPVSAERLRSKDRALLGEIESRLSHGGQVLEYLRAQRTYVELLCRYNPGMDMQQDERVRLTARRVGMDLPVEFGGAAERRGRGEEVAGERA